MNTALFRFGRGRGSGRAVVEDFGPGMVLSGMFTAAVLTMVISVASRSANGFVAMVFGLVVVIAFRALLLALANTPDHEVEVDPRLQASALAPSGDDAELAAQKQ